MTMMRRRIINNNNNNNNNNNPVIIKNKRVLMEIAMSGDSNMIKKEV